MSQCCQFMFQGLQFAAFITIYDAAKLQLFEKDNVKSKYTSHFCILHHRAQRITITLYLCGKRLITVLLLSLYLLLSSSLSLSLSLCLFISLSHFLSLSLSHPLSLFLFLSPLFLLHSHPLSLFTWGGAPGGLQLRKAPQQPTAPTATAAGGLAFGTAAAALLQYLPSMLQSHLGSQWVASRLRVQPLQVAMQN